MKYSAILISLVAGAVAIPQQASTITSAPASAASAALTPLQSCAVACPAGDVTCQAECLGIARPNSSQAVETTECAAKCDQGDGSPAATDKYSQCVQACIASHFPSSQTAGAIVSNAPSQAASNSASATGAVASGAKSASGTGAQPTGSSTASGAAASTTPSGAANINNVGVAGVGLAGLFMAVFAL